METEPSLHSPPVGHPQRPRGILKNRSTSNTNAHQEPPVQSPPPEDTAQDEREIVLQNTLHNAGRRRSSSRPSQPSGSRRQSGFNASAEADSSPRLKWDEANLYLAEQEREAAGARMKIDEPKTPFATRYDPSTDEMADASIDTDGLMVDEVDKKLLMSQERDIPDLDIGEAAENANVGHASADEKRVMVDESMGGVEEQTNGIRHGEELEGATEEEREKHRHFEELRKKHYEMKNIKNLLGHPESLDDTDDDR